MNATDTCRFAASALLAALAASSAATVAAASAPLRLGQPAAPVWMTGQAWIEQQIAAPDPGGIEAFGSVVAVQGDTAFVCSPKHPQSAPSAGFGVVYVYRYASGQWTLAQELVSDDVTSDSEVCNAIILQGSTALVANHEAEIDGIPHAGAVYVYSYDGTQWVRVQKLVADTPQLIASFGDSIALDGTTLVIGAANERGPTGDPSVGAAYVFDVDANGVWTQTQRLVSSTALHWDLFGIAVGIAGDAIMVGASQETWIDQKSGPGKGAVHVFSRSEGAWSETGVLLADDGVDGDYFGQALAFAGQTLVVGAPAVNGYQGAAYVFTPSGSGWTQSQKLVADDPAAAFFARSLALDGNQLVFGAPGTTVGETPFAGAAYLFTASGGTWAQTAPFTADETVVGDYFGFSVALVEGAHVFAGAPHDLDDGTNMPGAVYTYSADAIFSDGFEVNP